MPRHPDAVVVGAGPNGLAAALTLARAGWSVEVYEAEATVGGGCRTEASTLDGFRHDVCAAFHPLGAASPFFAALADDLARHGLRWRHFDVELAHPLPGGRAATLHRSVAHTAAALGVDADRYRALVEPLACDWDRLAPFALGPLLRPPRHPLAALRFGGRAVAPARLLAERLFRTPEARALLAGCAAHAFLPLERPLTAGFGALLLATGHVAGWPVAEGGSQAIVDALQAALVEAGGIVECGRPVRTLADVPAGARAVLFDTTPRALARIAGDALDPDERARLGRFRHGPAAFKIDYALDEAMPWSAPAARSAGTVHVGGTLVEIAASEAAVAAGRHPTRPFVLVGQQSLADSSRAPAGQHTLWAYSHVPRGSTVDMTDAIEAQIERFAPGWRDLVLARRVRDPAELARYNRNYVGGDISGGAHDGLQLLARPNLAAALRPYETGNPRLFLCSASTPPGAGVHGMCGAGAAGAVLRRLA